MGLLAIALIIIILVSGLTLLLWQGKPKSTIVNTEMSTQSDIREIKHWIRFFGVITIIGVIVGIVVALS